MSGASTTVSRSGSCQSGPTHASQDEESPIANGDREMLTILRGLQQQVSALQAQQSRASERTERTTVTTPSSSSLNDQRKLPKELTVSTSNYIDVCLALHCTCIGIGTSNCQALEGEDR